ncbi:MAG: DsrE/DsrF/DrsH-like family protein, partial [Planctomycetota bacterium]
HIGGTIASRDKLLVQTPESMHKRFRIDVRTRTEAIRINPQDRTLTVRDLQSSQQCDIPYDALILSPGAEPVRPPFAGADGQNVFTLRNLADMDRIKKVVDANASGSAVVVGGGYIGLEMTEALRERGLDVTLVELADHVFIAADAEMVAPVHQQLQLHGVDLRLGTSVTGIQDADDNKQVILSNGEKVAANMVILAVGVRPETQLAKQAGLEIGSTGGILVDKHMRTSDENIYAVGDAVQVKHFVSRSDTTIPLAGPANRQGRIAADNIFGRSSVYKDTQGTAICKVFDLAIGMTGLSEKNCKQLDIAYEKVYVHPSSHASYYPGAAPLSLKLLFDPSDGKVLGAQAVGADGVDKRIDVLATAIRAGLTVTDLTELELSYAPPYGSAKDPINYAGFVASNYLAGDMKLCHVEDVIEPEQSELLLDVRTSAEVEAGTIPGAKNIPIDELRERIDELPKDKDLLVFCAVGLRGYLAARMLEQKGYNARNLTGGYKTYKSVLGMLPADKQPAETPVSDSGDPGSGPDTSAEEDSEAELPMQAENVDIAEEVDARALLCPGPIMQLKQAIERIQPGQAVRIAVSDPGFASDIVGWCHSTGNRLLETTTDNGSIVAVVARAGKALQPQSDRQAGEDLSKQKSIVVFSGDFDKAMAAFIIANGAAAMGSDVTLFFTFWGLNILRKHGRVRVRKNLIEKMFGWMMPRGARKLKLSKMNMGGMGTGMIKGIMNKKNVASLPELIESARAAGVKLVACTMTMELMGIRKEELIDGVEEGGVAMYLDTASRGNVNLFI